MQVNEMTVLVTGASGGIGRALCRVLQSQGARLILNYSTPEALDTLRQESDAALRYVQADISTAVGRAALMRACVQERVDCVINLAGVLDFALFAEQDPGRIESTLTVNAVGTIMLTRALLPLLLTRPQARIINVGSIFASIGHPGFVVYCASKAAVKTFSEALARELADTSVSVAYIAPRATHTSLNSNRVSALNQALGNKTDSPELVADAIVAMLQGRAVQRFLGWPERLFVKLNALMPAFVHRALVKKLPLIKQYARSSQGATL